MVAGKWMIGGVSFGETLAIALGIPHVVGAADGISRRLGAALDLVTLAPTKGADGTPAATLTVVLRR